MRTFNLRLGIAVASAVMPAALGQAAAPVDAAVGGDSFVLLEHRRELSPRRGEGNISPSISPDWRGSPTMSRMAPSARRRMLPVVRAAEARHGLPAGLLDALIATESAYSPWAVSRTGAAGLAQLMPATAAELGVVNRFDPVQNIEGGARYLRRMLDRFGSISLALAAYNAGPGSVLRAGGIPFNGETGPYVARVLRQWTDLGTR